jgi:hypothetical protein
VLWAGAETPRQSAAATAASRTLNFLHEGNIQQWVGGDDSVALIES